MHLKTTLIYIITFFVSVLGWADRGKPVVAGYYPSYSATRQPPSKIPWSHYTHIDYFVIPVKGPTGELPIENEANLRETVELARAHNVSISLTLGGWTGSGTLSTIVGSQDSRDKFVGSIVDLIKKFNVDGVDIDWEYPGIKAMEGNAFSADDTSHFLEFLTSLRQQLGQSYRLSAAVSMNGFMGPDGQYMSDTRAFSEVLDYITIMAYDVFISGSGNQIAGPNSPLYHSCSASGHQSSVSSAVEAWLKTGFNPKKILLGVPAYGYGYTLVADALEPSASANGSSILFQKASPIPQGGKLAGEGGGQWLFHELHGEDLLTKNSMKGLSGYQRFYDNCTHTPYLYDRNSKHLIVYDDAGSIQEKAIYAKMHKLGGINVFDTTGDTPDLKLVEAIHVAYPPHHHSKSKKHQHLKQSFKKKSKSKLV